LQELDDGSFIQMSLEAVFLDEDGKQLLVTGAEVMIFFNRQKIGVLTQNAAK
jgi:hypothetical protein